MMMVSMLMTNMMMNVMAFDDVNADASPLRILMSLLSDRHEHDDHDDADRSSDILSRCSSELRSPRLRSAVMEMINILLTSVTDAADHHHHDHVHHDGAHTAAADGTAVERLRRRLNRSATMCLRTMQQSQQRVRSTHEIVMHLQHRLLHHCNAQDEVFCRASARAAEVLRQSDERWNALSIMMSSARFAKCIRYCCSIFTSIMMTRLRMYVCFYGVQTC